MAAEICGWLVAAGGESWFAWKKTSFENTAYRLLLLLRKLVSKENCCRSLLLVVCCWWGIMVRQVKNRLAIAFVVRLCCCWGILVSQGNGCRTLLGVGSHWWGILVGQEKTRLRNAACLWLLLPGILVSQENCCRSLLLVGSWWWGILVRQEKNRLAYALLGRWCCLLVVACRESCLAGNKTRLRNAFFWLVVAAVGKILSNQENGCRTLLLVGSCYLGIPVGHEKKLGLGMSLVIGCCY